MLEFSEEGERGEGRKEGESEEEREGREEDSNPDVNLLPHPSPLFSSSSSFLIDDYSTSRERRREKKVKTWRKEKRREGPVELCCSKCTAIYDDWEVSIEVPFHFLFLLPIHSLFRNGF